jgi:hypothetical protein
LRAVLTITEHVVPHQEERFTILADAAHFTLRGRAPGRSVS